MPGLERFTFMQLMVLHRHWIWANHMKRSLDDELARESPSRKGITLEEWFVGPGGMHMSLWYGLLFTVLDAMKQKRISLLEIDEDIKTIYEPLRLYRNAIFHAQPEYWSKKLLKVVMTKDSPAKIRRVHLEVGQSILDDLRRRHPPETA